MNISEFHLYEYQNKVKLTENFDEIEKFLDGIWQKREKNKFYIQSEDDEDHNKGVEAQRFLQFLHKDNEIKSNKYIGVIYYQQQTIHLLPKIFYSKNENEILSVPEINQHILWYLSYCSKIKFPHYSTHLSAKKDSFFEILIYLFSKYTKEVLSQSLYQQYEEINADTFFMKGRLEVNQYIDRHLSRGNWHQLNCTFDSFELDNAFNRVLKSVANMLFKITQSADSKKNLREILFILDDVSDIQATAEQCKNLSFNSFFADFEMMRDYCYLFLSNSISFTYKNGNTP